MNSTTKLWNFLKCGWDFHYIYLPLTLISMIFKVFLSEIPKVQNLKRFSQEIHCWLVNNCAHDYLSSFLNLLTRLIILIIIDIFGHLHFAELLNQIFKKKSKFKILFIKVFFVLYFKIICEQKCPAIVIN